jgi:hypothetical protein
MEKENKEEQIENKNIELLVIGKSMRSIKTKQNDKLEKSK